MAEQAFRAGRLGRRSRARSPPTIGTFMPAPSVPTLPTMIRSPGVSPSTICGGPAALVHDHRARPAPARRVVASRSVDEGLAAPCACRTAALGMTIAPSTVRDTIRPVANVLPLNARRVRHLHVDGDRSVRRIDRRAHARDPSVEVAAGGGEVHRCPACISLACRAGTAAASSSTSVAHDREHVGAARDVFAVLDIALRDDASGWRECSRVRRSEVVALTRGLGGSEARLACGAMSVAPSAGRVRRSRRP